jgi:nitrate reductase NapAB chaperone NapD
MIEAIKEAMTDIPFAAVSTAIASGPFIVVILLFA